MQTELTQSFQLWMVIWCKEAGQRQHMLTFTGEGTNTVVSWEKIIVCIYIWNLVTKILLTVVSWEKIIVCVFIWHLVTKILLRMRR
jgi:hypothetical protein